MIHSRYHYVMYIVHAYVTLCEYFTCVQMWSLRGCWQFLVWEVMFKCSHLAMSKSLVWDVVLKCGHLGVSSIPCMVCWCHRRLPWWDHLFNFLCRRRRLQRPERSVRVKAEESEEEEEQERKEKQEEEVLLIWVSEWIRFWALRFLVRWLFLQFWHLASTSMDYTVILLHWVLVDHLFVCQVHVLALCLAMYELA